MHSPERIAKLLFKHLQSTLTEDEGEELNTWRTASPENELLFNELTDTGYVHTLMSEVYRHKDPVWGKIEEQLPGEKERNLRIKWWTAVAAAALIILFCSGLYYFLHEKPKQNPGLASRGADLINDIPPGGNHALLTLADGSSIMIDSVQNGTLTSQGNVQVVKLDSGKIAYEINIKTYSPGKPVQKVDFPENNFNTLTTPRGGQFQVVLPDGTAVWLNASSSLRFPNVFSGTERAVVLTGEAYFEVAKNPSKPFRVTINNKAEIEVLGTHFNVNAYTEEATLKATLLEGSVKIKRLTENRKPAPSAMQPIVLRPGDQAQVDNSAEKISVTHDIDTDGVIAWKNGMTIFKNADLGTIMRTISRWYDVEIIYQGDIPHKSFAGGIPRNTNLSEVLKVLELNNIHFKLEGKKITVLP